MRDAFCLLDVRALIAIHRRLSRICVQSGEGYKLFRHIYLYLEPYDVIMCLNSNETGFIPCPNTPTCINGKYVAIMTETLKMYLIA